MRAGHNLKSTGARGLIDEAIETRKVKEPLISFLREAGGNVLDVTPENLDSASDLQYGVKKANDWNADLFISIHFNNAYKIYSGPLGSECYVYSTKDKYNDEVYAKRILDKLSKVGFKNRGVKTSTEFYELRETKMASVIVEVCFVESKEDIAIYKKVGKEEIAKKIAEGILNKTINNSFKTLYKVQLGAFEKIDNAKKLKIELEKKGYNPIIITNKIK